MILTTAWIVFLAIVIVIAIGALVVLWALSGPYKGED